MFLMVSVQGTKVFNFDEAQFMYFFSDSSAFGVVSTKALSNAKSQSFVPILSSKSCTALDFMAFKSMVLSLFLC